MLAGDPEGFIEALEGPSRPTIAAAFEEVGTLPPDIQVMMRARAQIVTDAILEGAARCVWRACERLVLEHPEDLSPDTIALIAAAFSVGQPSELADDDGGGDVK